MRTKVSIAVTSALMSAALLQTANAFEQPIFNVGVKTAKLVSVNKNAAKNVHNTTKFIPEKDFASGEHTYIVRLTDKPVATYDGAIKGFKATNPKVAKKGLIQSLAKSQLPSASISKQLRIDMKAPEVEAYRGYLKQKQANFVTKAEHQLGQNLTIKHQYTNAINGMAVRLTQKQAIQLAKLPEVEFIERSKKQHLLTDTGPSFIGATSVWQGSGQTATNMGEGIIIGVVDTGINSDHPSFADIGGDGYDHTNPLGAGNYIGDCANGFPEMCNDKLIGVRHYSEVTSAYSDTSVFGNNPPPANGEDYNGHGSHTASTAGGNIVKNVPILDGDSGKVESDGVDTGSTFAQISGVAPHANIIAYQICQPGDSGETDDTYAGCPTGAILKALDDAIADGVDVINFSISGGGNPWQDSSEQAFLAVEQAGIFAAVAAGNDGPNASTTEKSAPWYTAVAASTHGRTLASSITFNGNTYNFTNGSGPALKNTITGTLKSAKSVDSANVEGCDTWAADTFKDTIAFISRGTCTFEQKVNNATDAGATAVVVYNNKDGDTLITMSGLENTTIPAVFVSENSGIAMLADLDTDPSLTITIDPNMAPVHGDGDVMASFSSRGPNSYADDIMTPSVSAPGVSIYAAYADQMFGHDNTTPAPADYAFLQGTSMATPHVAGAGAVLKSSHPTWTPDEIRSALMLTATLDLKKEDGVTPADFFDMGAGRIRVDLADKTGLVMTETIDNYKNANPELGGDPKTLNIPSASNAKCVGSCSWTRTVTATQDGDWTVSGVAISSGLGISVSPNSFSLKAGESQTIQIDIDTSDAQSATWNFAQVLMTSPNFPDAHIPVSVKVSNGDIPSEINIETDRNIDTFTQKDVKAIEISEFNARSYGLTKGEQQTGAIAQDSDNTGVYDDTTDGTKVFTFTVPENAKRFVAEITASDAPDLDLFVGIDDNGDGIPQESEQIAKSTSSTAAELVDLLSPEAGSYWVMIQNYKASAEGATDSFTLTSAIIDGTEKAGLTITTANSAIPQLQSFDLNIAWELDQAVAGEKYYGAFDMGSSSDKQGNIGVVAVNLTRTADDVTIINDATARLNTGDTVNYTVSVNKNRSQTDRDYAITATIPAGLTLVTDSVSGNGTVEGNTITWTPSQPSLAETPNYYTVTNAADDTSCTIPDVGQGSGFADLSAMGIAAANVEGDNQSASFGISTNFLGQNYDGFAVTDDGYIQFSSSSGNSSAINQLLPDEATPNNLIAAFWRDMEFVKGEKSGLFVGLSDDEQWSIVQFAQMQHYLNIHGQGSIQPGDIPDILDFEVLINNTNGNFILAYDNVSHVFGDILGVTVGYEDSKGTSGSNLIYQPSVYGGSAGNIGSVYDIQSGTVFCYQLVEPGEVQTFNFSATVNDDFTGGNLAIALASSINGGAVIEQTTTTADIQVEGAPIAVISGSTSVQEESNVSLNGSNSTDPNGDTLSYKWEQVSGTNVSFNAASASISFVAPKVDKQGASLVFRLTVDDGHGNTNSTETTVTITDKPSSGGGSIVWLLLALPFIWLRRKPLQGHTC